MRPRFLAWMLFLYSVAAPAATPRETDWLELMPPDEVQALENAASTPAVPLDHSMRGAQTGSARTVAELDGKRIRLAGYIVPVDTSADGKLASFFLVPYFGACIHVPPPPPNQIILGRLAQPIEMTDIYDAFWITGTLKVEQTESDLAATAYSMQVEDVQLYE